MSGDHHALSPSSFPAWVVCPCFESDPEERADAAEGTAQHVALAAALSGDEDPFASLSIDVRESMTWATDYIRTLAGTEKIQSEVRLQYSTPDAFAEGGSSVVYYGTADAIIIHPPSNLADLIDYKSGADDRDHRAQICGYSLALFSERSRIKTIRCHVLYGRVRRVDSWSLTQADAAGIVLPILARRQDPERIPSACDYCTFCQHRMTCPALTNRVDALAKVNEWEALAPALRESAAITDPATMSKVLTLARFVTTWADSVRKAATELAKDGATLPGYRLQERRGTREVTDLEVAFTRSGLTQEQFISACKLSLSKLTDAFATVRGIPKAQAGREIEAMFDDLIQEGKPSVSLVADRKTA